MKKQYTATKSFLYGTRRLMAGDVFEAKPSVGRILVEVAKKATPVREPGSIKAPPAALAKRVSKPFADDDLAAARAEYQDATGKRPFHGWDAETLRAKITEAATDGEPATPDEAEAVDEAEAPVEEPAAEDETKTKDAE